MEAFTQDMLSPEDVSVDSHVAPSHLAVHLKQSKTDTFGVGATLHLGTTGTILCPITAMLGYLAIRQRSSGPLFLFTLKTPAHQSTAGGTRVDDSKFSGHSFRIGAATTAARAGLSDSFIQTLGHWKSTAFTTYIRMPWQRLTAVSATLVSPDLTHHTC